MPEAPLIQPSVRRVGCRAASGGGSRAVGLGGCSHDTLTLSSALFLLSLMGILSLGCFIFDISCGFRYHTY